MSRFIQSDSAESLASFGRALIRSIAKTGVGDIQQWEHLAWRLEPQVEQLLCDYRVEAFISRADASVRLTPEQWINLAADRVEVEKRARVQRYMHEREIAFDDGSSWLDRWEAASDANEPIVEGEWNGFMRSDSKAWSLALLEFEFGTMSTIGAMGWSQGMNDLKNDGVPFRGRSERARELVAQGFTPREYRLVRQRLGATPRAHAQALSV